MAEEQPPTADVGALPTKAKAIKPVTVFRNVGALILIFCVLAVAGAIGKDVARLALKPDSRRSSSITTASTSDTDTSAKQPTAFIALDMAKHFDKLKSMGYVNGFSLVGAEAKEERVVLLFEVQPAARKKLTAEKAQRQAWLCGLELREKLMLGVKFWVFYLASDGSYLDEMLVTSRSCI